MTNVYERKTPEQKKESSFSKLMAIVTEEKGKVIVGIIFAIIGTLFIIAAPFVLKQLGEELIVFENSKGATPLNMNSVWTLAAITAGLFLFGGLFQYVQIYIVSGCVARGAQKLRNQMIGKINHLPLNYFDTRNIGDVLSYVSNDVDVISTVLNATLSTVITSVITVIGVIAMLFFLDVDRVNQPGGWNSWKIGIVAVILLPIILFILFKVGGSSQRYFVQRSEKTARVSSMAEESYAGFNILRVFNAQGRNRDKFAIDNRQLESIMNKADFYSGVSIPMTTFLGNVLFSATALVGGIIAASFAESKDPALTASGITTVVAAVTYSDQLIAPITQIATNVAMLQRAIASATRIYKFLEETDEPDESNKTTTISNVQGNIKFDHVRFGYNKERIIVHDFCEEGKHGQKIAIVGPTGAGKTTMVNLLMRFYEVNSGSIRIDGVDTKEMNRSYVRGLFGMVLQDTWLFEGTIMENLKYSRPDASDEEVYAACKATHCDEFIRQQPGGYNRVLNEDCGLSAGQKQLLTIARAMVQNAPMLILDEATSSVDTRTELMIQEAMDALMKGRTSFVIAHRLSTIKNSDLIIVMKDGDVIETGNHDQLMKLDGFYAALYNSQFTGKGPQFS